MNTNEMTNQEISAFADGELAPDRFDAISKALRQHDAQAAWNVYHHIGDILRSNDMATTGLSDGFGARMAARLDLEPAFIAPQTLASAASHRLSASAAIRSIVAHRKSFIPAMAAVAAVAYFGIPQLLSGTGDAGSARVVEAGAGANGAIRVNSNIIVAQNSDAAAPSGVTVLRDPRIDEYLLAHQQFSPSVYSSAKFARSATFASDSNK